MSLGKIIGIIVAILIFIFGVIPIVISSLTEGLVIESIMQELGVSPIIIAVVAFLGFLLLLLIIFKFASATFS